MSAKIDFQRFAERWISDWNRKDIEAVLAKFSEDVVFTSPRAMPIVGSPRIVGKVQLKEYWTKALSRIQTIHFVLDYVIESANRMGIVYTSEINGKRMRSVEFLVFAEDGLVREGEAMHGIEL